MTKMGIREAANQLEHKNKQSQKPQNSVQRKEAVLKSINKNKLLVNILDLYFLKVPWYVAGKLLEKQEE